MARLENPEIAALFVEMADLLQIQGGDRHRIAAFRRAARILEGLPRPVAELIDRGAFTTIEGVGAGTLHRVEQMLRRGGCDDLDALRQAVPLGLRELLKIKGIGPTTVRTIHQRLGITTLEQLEHAAKSGAIETIPRMGLSHAHKILAGIEAYRRRRGKVALIDAQRVGRRIVAALAELPQVQRVELAGSVRRGKAAVGDLDVLVAAVEPGPIVARFSTLPEVEAVLLRGDGRTSVRLHSQQQADLRILPLACFGAGLHTFTGSKLHNIEIRKRAGLRGLKVSDRGVFTRDERLLDPCGDEATLFSLLDLPWIPPELRENQGEIEAAEAGALPRLIEAGDLLGDLHMHSRDSDGRGDVAELAERARALGLQYIAITDHSKALTIANGLDEARLAAQATRIRALDRDQSDLRVLAGVEVDILRDGSLDLDLDLLASLDWVVASVHQWTDMSREQMTARVIRAIESGVVDCIGHPTGRRPGKRDPFAIDMEAVIAAAARHQVALECNGGPNRMDLGDVDCRRCRERGVAVAIDTDAHAPAQLGRWEYGLSMARRGWLARADVLNAQPWPWIAARRARRLRDRGAVVGTVQVAVAKAVAAKAVVAAGFMPDGFVLEEIREQDQQAHAWTDLEPLDEAAPVAAGSVQTDRGDEDDGDAGDESDAAALETSRAAPVDPRAVAALVASLRATPVDEAVRRRVSEWLTRGGGDPLLDEALHALGDNPVQVAFDLLYLGA